MIEMECRYGMGGGLSLPTLQQYIRLALTALTTSFHEFVMSPDALLEASLLRPPGLASCEGGMTTFQK